MAKKEETKEIKEKTQDAHKKEAPAKEVLPEVKKEKKGEKSHEGKGEEKVQAKKERKGAPKEGKKEGPAPKDAGPEIKHIIRMADTDLDGKRSVQYALTGIKGVSRRIAKILALNSGLDPIATLGYLNDADIDKLHVSVDNLQTIVPYWMMNKQNDFMTGEDRHVIGTDVILSLNEDLNTMKKIRSYKGVRHEKGLKVRGQRTRSTGRKGRTVGVSRATLTAAKAATAKEGEKTEEKKGGGK